MNYSAGILVAFIKTTMIVQLEYNVSINKEMHLRDKYSHELGNIIQVLKSSLFVLQEKGRELQSQPDGKIEGMISIADKKCNEASELIRKIRELE
ncbi:MAG: hypothetical protein ACTSUE_18135 [Promethearchaeota archaeon]